MDMKSLIMRIIACGLPILFMAAAARANDELLTEPGALDFVNIRTLVQTDPNLTGKGVFIGTICRSQSYVNGRPKNDYHFNMTHHSIYDADVKFMDGTDGSFGISEHATSIAGILLGLDENAADPAVGDFRYHGVCPDASVDAYEFEQFSIRYILGKKPIADNILVLSLGIMFEDWWVRGLEQAAAVQDILVVASVGNGASSYTPDPLFPAAGSNVLSVGVVDAVTDSDGTINWRDFSTPKSANSSTGPTEDRRCKPDIVAPGTALVPAADSEYGYELKHNWSSLSAPVVAGTAALLQQKAMSDDALKNDFDKPGKGLVLKSILLNSARKLPYWHKGDITPDDDQETPLDYTQGAGLLDATAAHQQLSAGRQKPGAVRTVGWDNRVLDTSSNSYEYTFEVTDPNRIITATLCWNRAYQPEYPFAHLLEKDMDLRLELWAAEPNNLASQILLDYSDSVNDNVEHIYFTCEGPFSSYTVKVLFNEQQERNTSQRFALAWSVGPDRQAKNPWWYDLNADDIIDEHDKIIYYILNNQNIVASGILFESELFKLHPERAELLINQWPQFAPYLTDWATL